MTAHAELGQTDDPVALVPGNVEAVFDNARVLRDRATDALAAGEALKRIEVGYWRGPAYEAWSQVHDAEVPKWLATGDALAAAAQALDMYANTLGWAQGQALNAIALHNQGDQATTQARAAHEVAVRHAEEQTRDNIRQGGIAVVPRPEFSDPGEAYREAARELLQRARDQLRDVGDETVAALRDLTAGAPGHAESTVSMIAHLVLDVAGMVPGVGEAADLTNAGFYAAQGRYTEAGLTAAAAVPFLGWGAGAAKIGKNIEKIADAGEHGGEVVATFGQAVRKDYRKTFFEAHPTLRGEVVVHHAVEQQARRVYPGAGITDVEMHSLENLRGIPKEVNSRLHLREIRKEWDEFYRNNPNATKDQLLEYATRVDRKFGDQFTPPR